MVIKKIKPMFTAILTTNYKYAVDDFKDTIIVDAKKLAGATKDIQKVIAVGSMVRNIKEGDLVCIDPERYAVKKYQENSVKKELMEQQVVGYNIPIIEIDGDSRLLLDERDVKYIIEEYEEEKPDSGIIHPNSDLIL